MGLAIDQYLLRERIAAGGMGVVWRADHRAITRDAPVKLVRPDPDALPGLLSRLCQEAHAASDPAHPSAVATIDLGMGALLVMEHVEGVTLAHELRAGARFTLTDTLHVVTQMLRALEQAHAAGIVHADLRPEHVVITARPGLDDLVTLVDDDDADDDEWVGSAYLAPEVIAGGRPTVASDLYSVGAILYELLTGAPPFVGGSVVEVMTHQLRDPVVPPSVRRRDLAIPAGIELATLRALARSPAARFADAASFLVEVEAATRALPAPRRPAVSLDLLRAAVAAACERGVADAIADRYVDLALALWRSQRHTEAFAALAEAAERIMWDESLGPHSTARLLTRLDSARALMRDTFHGHSVQPRTKAG